MIGGSNEYDEVIFDYLEGNLSVDERKAFEAQWSCDESLRAETVAWKKTYVVESFPATALLEKQILGTAKRTRWFFSLNLFTVVLVLLFIPSRLKDGATVESSKKLGITSNPVNLVTEPLHSMPSLRLKEISPNQNNPVKTRQVAEPEAFPNRSVPEKMNVIGEEDVMISVPAPETSALKRLSVSRRNLKLIQVRLPSTSGVRRFSWKETRAINRKKRRDYQKKTESKFLEGNVPYVVPLDIKNF